MKRKLEKKIIDLAFGELSQTQSGSVERELGTEPEAAQTLNAYRQMREGLKDLNDIPPMQMSTERMREAILQRGLKPKRDWSFLNWVAVPLAAGVLAVAVTSTLKKSSGGPVGPVQVAMNNSHLEDQISLAFGSSNPFGDRSIELTNKDAALSSLSFGDGPDASDTDTTTVQPPAAPVVRTVSVQPRTRGKLTYRHGGHNSLSDVANAIMLSGDSNEPKIANPPVMAPPEVDSRSEDIQPAPASKIVLVDAVKDSDTGAQRAIEVGSSTNVVVGG